jgi:hypothetical protein
VIHHRDDEICREIRRAIYRRLSNLHGNPESLLAAGRREIGADDPNVAPATLGTLQEHLAFALFPVQITSVLLGIFGLLAIVLALAGISGLIAIQSPGGRMKSASGWHWTPRREMC